MNPFKFPLTSLIFLFFITSCSAPAISPAERTGQVSNVIGTWETRRILANGYYSEFLKVELFFNEDGSCKQISSFESSGGPYQIVNCSFKVDNQALTVNFENQPPLQAKFTRAELILAHPYGVSTGSGSPQTFARVNQLKLEK
jgi:hypothetical protein